MIWFLVGWGIFSVVLLTVCILGIRYNDAERKRLVAETDASLDRLDAMLERFR